MIPATITLKHRTTGRVMKINQSDYLDARSRYEDDWKITALHPGDGSQAAALAKALSYRAPSDPKPLRRFE